MTNYASDPNVGKRRPRIGVVDGTAPAGDEVEDVIAHVLLDRTSHSQSCGDLGPYLVPRAAHLAMRAATAAGTR